MILYCSFSNKMSVDDQNHWICVGSSRLLHSVLGKFSHVGMNFAKQTQRLEFAFWINKVWHTKTAQLRIESGCRAFFNTNLYSTVVFHWQFWVLHLSTSIVSYLILLPRNISDSHTASFFLTYINFTNICTLLNWGFTGKMWWTSKMMHGYWWISCSTTSCNIKMLLTCSC